MFWYDFLNKVNNCSLILMFRSKWYTLNIMSYNTAELFPSLSCRVKYLLSNILITDWYLRNRVINCIFNFNCQCEYWIFITHILTIFTCHIYYKLFHTPQWLTMYGSFLIYYLCHLVYYTLSLFFVKNIALLYSIQYLLSHQQRLIVSNKSCLCIRHFKSVGHHQ